MVKDKLEGGEFGFHRRGLPNTPHRNENIDDPRAFEKIAIDIQEKMEKIIKERPELKITKDTIDEIKSEYVAEARLEGFKVLEDDLEHVMGHNVEGLASEREEIINRLALALAYLEVTAGVNEEFLDLPERGDD